MSNSNNPVREKITVFGNDSERGSMPVCHVVIHYDYYEDGGEHGAEAAQLISVELMPCDESTIYINCPLTDNAIIKQYEDLIVRMTGIPYIKMFKENLANI